MNAKAPVSFIRCYAQVSDACYNGSPSGVEADDYEMRDDGTYVEQIDAVCCTPCYTALGCPDNAYLTLAIMARKGVRVREEAVRASELEPGDLWSFVPTEWAKGITGNKISLAVRSGNVIDDGNDPVVYRVRIERTAKT